MVLNARWAGNLLAVLHLRPSRLAIIVPPWEFGPALTSYRTHRRTSNFPQTAPIVGSRFLDRAHYNEFVESGAKSCREWDDSLFWGWKAHRIGRPNRPREKGPLARGQECTNPLTITQEPPSCFWASLLFLRPPSPLWMVSIVIYFSLLFILLLHLSVIHAYPQVHVPSAILSGALWAAVAPIALSKGHIHIKGGQGVSCVYLIRRWQLFLGLPPHLLPYG